MMKKLLSHWWFRIILFIGVSIIFFLPNLVFSFGTLFSSIFFAVDITIISILIYSLRAGSDYKAFGLQFDKFTLIDLSKGFLIVLGANLTFILIGLIMGYEYSLVDNINYDNLLFYAAFIFFGSFTEEILFRGVIFQSIRERFGDIIAVIVLSIFFSLVHAANPNVSVMALINVVLAGILLSVMYITTESLWFPISFHFFWNYCQQSLLGSNISGIDFGIQIFELTAVNGDSSWLFGGAFGIEEGVLTTIILTILILLTFKISKQNPYIMATKFKMKYEESKLLEK